MFDWDSMKNKIILADNKDVMKDIPDKFFELAIVDPPYRDSAENHPTKDMRRNGTLERFGNKPDKSYFDELFRVSINQIIWGANNFILPNYKGFVVWKKLTISDAFTMSMAEIAYISEGLGTTSKVFEYAPQGTAEHKRIHPTQKPIALYRWLLQKYAKPNDKIIDTHSGSGSLACACHLEGYEFIAIEKDEEYWRRSVQRYNDIAGQKLLFA